MYLKIEAYHTLLQSHSSYCSLGMLSMACLSIQIHAGIPVWLDCHVMFHYTLQSHFED